MIKIVAKRYLKEGALPEYTALVKELVDLTRLEAGCVDYGFYYEKEQNLAVMMETWETQSALSAHLTHIIGLGWPAKLNAYADPNRKGGVEQFEQIY